MILEPREIEDTTILNLEPRISDDDDTAEEMTTQLILQPRNSEEENIEFTKVLTKYSTEYNNQLFLHNITQKINFTLYQ